MDTIQPGQMLGPYRIINQIGKGGMATVYKAYQASVDRYVAVKVLPSQLAESKEFAARFQQEARFIAKLEHPHILPVFDYGESDGVAYFVMRYLEAGTLKEKMIEGRPLPLNDIDKIFTQLAEALSYAHGRGIVHRDLKPANALIDSQGNVFLTDFGIAKLLESASPRLTQTDAILGTPAYISPEQAQAQPVDQRSDIYSLGIILYEMVTGSVPFVAQTPLAVLFKHISDPLPPPSLVKPDVPASIEKVILKALEKNPQNRFATAAEFVTAWKRAMEERETVAQQTTLPPSSPPSASNQVQRRPAPATSTRSKAARPTAWIMGCLAILCLLFSVGGIGVLALNLPIFSPSPTPTETPFPPTPTTTTFPPTETVVPVNLGSILLEDDFSSSQWGTGTDADSSIEYADEALQFIVYKKNWFVWSTPNDEDYQNVHMEVTVLNHGTDTYTAFRLMCNRQPSSDASFYYFAVTPAGQYAIAKATGDQSDVFFTNNNEWAISSLISQNASSYRVGAACSNGTLTLYVDGKQIASVSDSSYTNGGVAIFTWSAEEPNSTNVSFDDFLMRSLE